MYEPMTHFPKYGLGDCRINPLRGLLSVHARFGRHQRLAPDQMAANETRTARIAVFLAAYNIAWWFVAFPRRRPIAHMVRPS